MKRREVIQASARFRRAGRTTAPHFCFGSLSSVFLRSDSNGDEKAPLAIDGRFAAELDAFTDHVQVKGYQRVIIQPFEYKKSYLTREEARKFDILYLSTDVLRWTRAKKVLHPG
jgi:hypothetical protein